MASKKTSPATPELFSSDLDYLQHEHRWLELRSQRLHAEQKLDGRHGRSRRRGFYEDDEPSPATLRRRGNAAGRDEAALRSAIDARLAEHQRQGCPLAIQRLCELYQLGEFERLVLLLATGPALDRQFEHIFERADELSGGGLTVDSTFIFAELELSDRVAHRKLFGIHAPLRAHDLLQVHLGGRYSSPEDLLTASISITGRALDLLLGNDALGAEFEEFSSLEQPQADLERVVLPARDKQRILSVVERHELYLAKREAWGFDELIRYGRGALMLFHGPPGTGKTMTAHAVAQHLGRRVLNVDIPTFLESQESRRFLPGLFREARLHDAVLFFDECDALFESRRRGNVLMTMLLTEIERFEGVAVLATNMPEVLDEALHRRILVKVRFGKPDAAAREAIWAKHLPERAPLADDVDLHDLAWRYELTGGEIKNAVLVAVAATVHDNGGLGPITQAQLERAAADQLPKPDPDEHGVERLEWTKARMDDLILPPLVAEQVAELIAAARHGRTVVESWGVGAHLTGGRGVVALLHGPPGTGKTLCAEVVAAELNRPLLRSVVPGLLSKWVGETERRIANLFEDARKHNAVLLLDEVDALLMERGAANASRHDDAHVSCLLDQLERHQGVVIMATNRPTVLDPALARRVAWRIEVPMPDETARAAIWERLIPTRAPTDGRIDFARLAARHPLSGGLIRTAVFRACYRAAHRDQPLTQRLLDEAAGEQSGVEAEGPALMTMPAMGEC
jgi:SpoVK/Ycf46/Vps4 family AAA+-type ATPase